MSDDGAHLVIPVLLLAVCLGKMRGSLCSGRGSDAVSLDSAGDACVMLSGKCCTGLRCCSGLRCCWCDGIALEPALPSANR